MLGIPEPGRKPQGTPEAFELEKRPRYEGNLAASISWLVKGPQAFPLQEKELEMVWHQQQ
jgi:hypothetical protein